jgi:hypothetical protein
LAWCVEAEVGEPAASGMSVSNTLSPDECQAVLATKEPGLRCIVSGTLCTTT